MANLINRKDVTAARPQPQQAPPKPAQVVFSESEQELLRDISVQLRHLARREDGDLQQICITDREPAQNRLKDFPAPGINRLIIRRSGGGGRFILTAATFTQLLAPNEARLGGQVVVVAATAEVDLYLVPDTSAGGTAQNGVPIIGLLQSGTWDLRLSEILWSGSVFAISSAPATITVAEV